MTADQFRQCLHLLKLEWRGTNAREKTAAELGYSGRQLFRFCVGKQTVPATLALLIKSKMEQTTHTNDA